MQTNLNHLAHTGKLVFHGYANANDRALIEGKPGAAAQLTIGVKEYAIDKQNYDAFFADATLLTEETSLLRQAYDMASNVLDCLNPAYEPPLIEIELGQFEQHVDGNGEPKWTSFFENSEDV